MHSKTKTLSLALQGGGAHSAFSWGVIDQLLSDGRIDIEAISATSGGSMIACIVAQGLADGGRDGAREALSQFWRKVSLAASLLPMRMTIVDTFLGHVGIDTSATSIALDYITRIFSPYQFNLFDINPLRGIIEEMVDFSALNKKSPVQLFINATNARTGKSKIFDTKHISLDAVMASCCLPYLFKTVVVDEDPYWDGSFSGCPLLAPLANDTGSPDILLVQIHPSSADDVPTSASDILDRATEISFHSVLLQELKTIALYNRMIAAGTLEQKPVYLHRIEAQDMLASLGRASKLNTDWEFLLYLRDLGTQAASDWLAGHFDAIGNRSSVDINAIVA